ncbi:hypothetical protein Vretifemale_5972 [Volvox reticuliferus]|uniref:DNA topoisomerase (ATP-hydrolyzing) n=2 Tax=Volvox reticuliferus TaxID=1737510 RepID=A0A8J4FJ19_9CHLO|nr:hypothetical protein Vretifemale_5972 [Volvox reticuliferus]
MAGRLMSGQQFPAPEVPIMDTLRLNASSILARIETTVESLVTEIAEGCVPTLQLASRSRSRNDGAGQQQDRVGLQRSLLSNKGAAAVSYARVLAVLNAVHDLLRQGRQATQRDLYYTLLQPPLFNSPREVNAAVADAAALVGVPRSGLGVNCAGRGAVAGRLQIRDGPASPWVDCSTAGPSGRALPGDLATIARFGLQLMPAATGPGVGASGGVAAGSGYLLVVEKDAVFQRLAEDRIWDHLPCVLLTARGMPDLATRAFAARLAACFPPPRLQPVGLVDYNPSGVIILASYKYGSDRLGPEGRAHPLPGLRWLGLRSGHLADMEQQDLQPLSERDHALMRGLRERLGRTEPGWVSELTAMETAGYKADIEVVYRAGAGGYGALRDLVVRAVLSRDLI